MSCFRFGPFHHWIALIVKELFFFCCDESRCRSIGFQPLEHSEKNHRNNYWVHNIFPLCAQMLEIVSSFVHSCSPGSLPLLEVKSWALGSDHLVRNLAPPCSAQGYSGYLTSAYLTFSICKMRIVIVPPHRIWPRINDMIRIMAKNKWHDTYEKLER